MKANSDRFCLLLNGTRCQRIDVQNYRLENIHCQKILGIKTDIKLKFEDQVKTLHKKASQKLNDLARTSSYMTFEQRKLVLDSF